MDPFYKESSANITSSLDQIDTSTASGRNNLFSNLETLFGILERWNCETLSETTIYILRYCFWIFLSRKKITFNSTYAQGTSVLAAVEAEQSRRKGVSFLLLGGCEIQRVTIEAHEGSTAKYDCLDYFLEK